MPGATCGPCATRSAHVCSPCAIVFSQERRRLRRRIRIDNGERIRRQRLVTRSASELDVRWHAGILNNGLFFRAMYHLTASLPRRGCYAVAHPFTWLAYRLMHDGTNAVVQNLRVVKPEASDEELQELALLTYRSYARDFVDLVHAVRMKKDDFRPLIAGFDGYRFDELLAEKRGI